MILLASGKSWTFTMRTGTPPTASFHLSCIEACPYLAFSSHSWKSQHELLVFVLMLCTAAKGNLCMPSAVQRREESAKD